MTPRSKIVTALRAKFKDPREVLRKLGLDADLLGAPAASGGGDPVMALRTAIENLLGDLPLDERHIAHVLRVLDEHAPGGKLAPGDPQKEAAGAIAGQDDNDDWLSRVKAFCRSRGLSDGDTEKVATMIQGGAPIADMRLPDNAIAGGRGGRLSTDARPKSFSDRHPEVSRVFPGGGESSPRAAARGTSFASRHPEVDRIRGA